MTDTHTTSEPRYANGSYATWERYCEQLERLLGPDVVVGLTEFSEWSEPEPGPTHWRNGRPYWAPVVRAYGWSEEQLEKALEALGFEAWSVDSDTDERGAYSVADVTPGTGAGWMQARLREARRLSR